MIKKIALATLLVATLASAKSHEKGIVVGLNLDGHNPHIAYKQVGTVTSNHEISSVDLSISPKIGYQYYFTRIFFLINRYDYNEGRNRYSIKGMNYEVNVDYIPEIYKDEKDTIHLVVGVSAGMSVSTLYNIHLENQLLPVSPITPYEYKQKNFSYGVNLGLMLKLKKGLSVEAGLKWKKGTLLEFQDDERGTNRATFTLGSAGMYAGINYLF